MSIELTPAAAEEIRSILQQQEPPRERLYLRVGLRTTGLRQDYILDLGERESEDEQQLESQGLPILCKPKDLLRLDGVTIDFREQAGMRGFIFNVPQRWGIARPGAVDPGQPAPDEQQVRTALREVIDPEVGCNVVDLGLVYGITINGREVHIEMTMTTPACPLTEQIKGDAVERTFALCPGAALVEVEVVWEPRWTPQMISEEARRTLGWSR